MSVKSILVIRTGGVGDFLVTLPFLAALRKAFPDAFIEVLGNPGIAALAADGCHANKIASINDARMAPFFSADSALPEDKVQYFRRFELIISFLPDEDGVLGKNLERATKARVLFCRAPGRREDPAAAGRKLHAAEVMLSAMDILAGDPCARGFNSTPELKISLEEVEHARSFLMSAFPGRHNGMRIVAVHPGAGAEEKRWGLEGFLAVCRFVLEREKNRLLVVSGEADEAVVRELLKSLRMGPGTFEGRVAVASCLPLRLLGAVLRQCCCYLGNDSGISHLAAAAGVPTVAVFGPSDPEVWAPKGRHVRILRPEEGMPITAVRPAEAIATLTGLCYLTPGYERA